MFGNNSFDVHNVICDVLIRFYQTIIIIVCIWYFTFTFLLWAFSFCSLKLNWSAPSLFEQQHRWCNLHFIIKSSCGTRFLHQHGIHFAVFFWAPTQTSLSQYGQSSPRLSVSPELWAQHTCLSVLSTAPHLNTPPSSCTHTCCLGKSCTIYKNNASIITSSRHR